MNEGNPIISEGSSLGYTCNCSIEYTGPSCEYINSCANSNCKNNATCLQLEEGSNSYICICGPDFSGDLCQYTIDQTCLDSDPEKCRQLSSFCRSGTYKNIPVKNYCKKTCKNCSWCPLLFYHCCKF